VIGPAAEGPRRPRRVALDLLGRVLDVTARKDRSAFDLRVERDPAAIDRPTLAGRAPARAEVERRDGQTDVGRVSVGAGGVPVSGVIPAPPRRVWIAFQKVIRDASMLVR
jgi:hypothetical protein